MQPCQNYSWPPRAGRYQQTGDFLPLFHTSLSTRSELFAARNGSSSYPRCMRTESPGHQKLMVILMMMMILGASNGDANITRPKIGLK